LGQVPVISEKGPAKESNDAGCRFSRNLISVSLGLTGDASWSAMVAIDDRQIQERDRE